MAFAGIKLNRATKFRNFFPGYPRPRPANQTDRHTELPTDIPTPKFNRVHRIVALVQCVKLSRLVNYFLSYCVSAYGVQCTVYGVQCTLYDADDGNIPSGIYIYRGIKTGQIY